MRGSTSRTCRGARPSSPPRRAASGGTRRPGGRAACSTSTAERHDVHLHPSQQRPHRALRRQGRLQARHRVRRRGRSAGHGRRADRVERRLGRRRGEPPSPLRGAPRRRRRRQPVPVPQRGRAPALPRAGSARRSRSACVASPVAAGGGMLELRATAVRWWPGGQWTPVVGERPVTLAIARRRRGRHVARRGAREPLAARAAGAFSARP